MSPRPSLVFLTQRIPFPPDKGDKIRSFHILQQLSASFRIHLGCFFDDPHDARHVPALKEFCDTSLCLPLRKPVALVRGALSLLRGASLTQGYFGDARMRRWVDATVASRAPQALFVYCSAMAPYAMAHNVPVVMDMVDVDSQKWRAYAGQARGPKAALYRREAAALLGLERRAAAGFQRTFLSTAAEEQLFRHLAPECAARLGHFPNGVDTRYFDPAIPFDNPFPAGADVVLFTGAMDYRPNIAAVEWFADTMLESLRAARPAVQFWIVGANPAPAVLKLARRPGIHVTGRVPDMRPYLAHAACAVAPLQIARGVQNKVLEALAMARPVIATAAAIEGLSAVAGQELVQADRPGEFVAAIQAVLDGQMPGLGRRGRARIEADYSWRQALEPLEAALGAPQAAPDAVMAS